MTNATDRAAINRHKAQKSTGPKTVAGKNRSRFNAVKHGLTAKTIVLPGEDDDAFRSRLDVWIGDLKPQNDVKHDLVERAGTITWQLDRADCAETARLSSLIAAAPEALALRQADIAEGVSPPEATDPGAAPSSASPPTAEHSDPQNEPRTDPERGQPAEPATAHHDPNPPKETPFGPPMSRQEIRCGELAERSRPPSSRGMTELDALEAAWD